MLIFHQQVSGVWSNENLYWNGSGLAIGKSEFAGVETVIEAVEVGMIEPWQNVVDAIQIGTAVGIHFLADKLPQVEWPREDMHGALFHACGRVKNGGEERFDAGIGFHRLGKVISAVRCVT